MKHIEITNKHKGFRLLRLKDILLSIQKYVDGISWSLQLIEAVGNIEQIVGMNMLTLEHKCKLSKNGFPISFEALVDLSSSFDDIIEILIVGCKNQDDIPKAYSDSNWEKRCDIIISREDSSLWRFYSKDRRIMDVFRSFKQTKEV